MNKNNLYYYEVTKLTKQYDKRSFTCGVAGLDQYLLTQANQDIKKNVSITYVLTQRSAKQILGYYTLSSSGIIPGELTAETIKKLPRYPVLPAILLGRLAVDIKYQAKKIGGYLLMDALQRSLMISQQVGATAMIVNAKDKKAAGFYKYYDFIEFPENDHKLFLLMDTIKILFAHKI